MSTNKPESLQNLHDTTNTNRKLNSGAYGIRGFHYQHVYGMLLAVRSKFDSLDIETIIPEGSDDYEIQTSHGLTLIDTKTVSEKRDARTVQSDAEAIKDIWKRPTRDGFQVNEYHLVLNRGHKGYNLIDSKKPITQTDLKNYPEILDDKSKFENSHIVVEEDPFAQAVKIVTKKLAVLPAIANILCSILTHKIIDKAIANGGKRLEDRVGLNKADIERTINDVMMVCQSDKVEKLIRTGVLRECDFTPAPTSPDLYLNVNVRLGHVTSNQVISQQLDVKRSTKLLENSKMCFITGPSGTGKSALMWQIVNETRDKVCWYEVTAKSEFDAEALTMFLRSTSRHQRVGFVVDDVGSGKSAVADQLIRKTVGNENVCMLGSLRLEDSKLSPFIKKSYTFHYQPDKEIAKEIFDVLIERGKAKVSNWLDAWNKTEPLLMEYIFLLTKGKSLYDGIYEQLQSRLFGRNSAGQRNEIELDILRAVMPVAIFGGRVNLKCLQTKTGSERLSPKDTSFSASPQRNDESIAYDYGLARAITGLTGEFILRNYDSDEVFGLNNLRTRATIEALIELGCLARKDLAVTAVMFANINTIEHVSFRIISENLMTADEIVTAFNTRQIEDEEIITYWTRIGFGIRQGLLHKITNDWYQNKFLRSIFPPSMANPVVFSSPFEQVDDLPNDIKSSVQVLSYALNERIDAIKLPHLVVFNIINSLRMKGTKLSPDQIIEALSTLVGIQLGKDYHQQLQELKLNFNSICIFDVAKILDVALEISREVQEAWIVYYEKSSTDKPLTTRLEEATAFALPIDVKKCNGDVEVVANFSDCVLLTDEQKDVNREIRAGTTENIRNHKGKREIDHAKVMKEHWDWIKAIVPKAKRFNSELIDIYGNASPFHESCEIKDDLCTMARQKFSESVSRAIEANYMTGDWLSFLEKEEKLLDSLFDLCIEHLNRITVRGKAIADKTRQFIELTDNAESLFPPERDKNYDDGTFLYSPPLKSITKLIGSPLIKKLYNLPNKSAELVLEVDAALTDLEKIHNEPWELANHKPEQLLEKIEIFLNNIRMIALEACRSNTNPLKKEIIIPNDSASQAFTILAGRISDKFRSFHNERQKKIEDGVERLFPGAKVNRSDVKPSARFNTRYVILLPIEDPTQWTDWFTNAPLFARKLIEIFNKNENYSIIPIINHKYGVGYRWEHLYEEMLSELVSESGYQSLHTNRFLVPNQIIFKDVDFSQVIPNLTIYEDFTRLCAVNNFLFNAYDGKRDLEKEFEVYDEALILLQKSYLEFLPTTESITNQAIATFCDQIERAINGQYMLNSLKAHIDYNLLLTGFADIIWQKTMSLL